MTSHADPELILFMDSCTGEVVIECRACDYEQTVAKPDNMREFRTGLVYEDSVVVKIRSALNKRGVRAKGVPGKCINISKDWLVQMLTVIYSGLDRKLSDRMAHLINAANNNSDWKNNPGIELQKRKQKEYWDKVEQFSRKKQSEKSSTELPGRSGIKALIVEDDMVSSWLMNEYISPLGECDLASNGSEAIRAYLEAIDNGKFYDLITLDIMMPEMDGREVLKRIRSIEEERGIDAARIIMTTAMDDAREIMTAFKEQCDGYLVKPIRKEELMKRLREFNLLE